jgi:hypothetical protein
MSSFVDVVLNWDGKQYTIKAYRVLGAVARIEDHVTMVELMQAAQAGSMPVAKVAMALGAVLKYAGAPATPEDVYEHILTSSGAAVLECLNSILELVVPPSLREVKQVKDPFAAAAAVTAVAPSSKKRTKP